MTPKNASQTSPVEEHVNNVLMDEMFSMNMKQIMKDNSNKQRDIGEVDGLKATKTA